MSSFVDYYIAEFDYYRWVLYDTIELSDMCCLPLFLFFLFSHIQSLVVLVRFCKLTQGFNKFKVGLKLINDFITSTITKCTFYFIWSSRLYYNVYPFLHEQEVSRSRYHSVRWIKQTRNYTNLNGNVRWIKQIRNYTNFNWNL